MEMDVGFETIGNATFIFHDRTPLLVTDPWVTGSAYFGSWTFSHEIPEAQRDAIARAPYAWVSHGHPDHLNGDSLPQLQGKTILLADHVGGRVREDLTSQGFHVRVLPDRSWVQLSPRVHVLSIADYNQDSILLVNVNGRLVLDLNDASDRGWGSFVRREVKKFKTTFLGGLTGYGDADMLNFWTEDGVPIPPQAALKVPVGPQVARLTEFFGGKFFIPSSSMHRYQRADSVFANEYTTPIDAHGQGFASRTSELLPAFIRFDCERDQLERIDPKENPAVVHPPEAFGDHWSEPLEPEDRTKLDAYFRSIQHLSRSLDFINLRVGGEDNRIEFNRDRFCRGITFEVPRTSLMSAVQYQIFDDLLIGNFMRTTLHGEWGPRRLYPDFSPWVAKYADNGRAKTDDQIVTYMETYRKRDPVGFLKHTFDSQVVRPAEEWSADFLRTRLGGKSRTFRLAKQAYHAARRLL